MPTSRKDGAGRWRADDFRLARATVSSPEPRKEAMTMHGSALETSVLLEGFGMGESPRWRTNCGSRAGERTRSSRSIWPGTAGDRTRRRWQRLGGRLVARRTLLVTGSELLRVEPDGSRVRHADLSGISPCGWSELTVDGRSVALRELVELRLRRLQRCPGQRRDPGRSPSSPPMERHVRSPTASRSQQDGHHARQRHADGSRSHSPLG